MTGRIIWNKSSNAGYDIYKSELPGGPYQLEQTVVSEADTETYEFDYTVELNNLNGFGSEGAISLSWKGQHLNTYHLFKIVPLLDDFSPSYQVISDSPWITNSLPSGADWTARDGIEWCEEHTLGSNPSLRITVDNGMHNYSQISGARHSINDRYIVIWVFLEKENRPDSLLISLYANGSVGRGYWGKNIFPYGTEGTQGMRYLGGLPSCNTWFPLVIDTDELMISNITGIGFGLYKQETEDQRLGIIYLSSIHTSNQRPYAAIEPIPSVEYFNIDRRLFRDKDFKRVGSTRLNEFIDPNAPDIFGYSSSNKSLTYTLSALNSGTEIKIRWAQPMEEGTTYLYRISPVDSLNNEHASYLKEVTVSSNHGFVKISASTDKNFTDVFFTATEYGNEMVHKDLVPNTTYYYKLETYSPDGILTSSIIKEIKTKEGSLLDFFIFDLSELG